MKTTFYLFRHGVTDWNKQRRLQGIVDIPLNEEGRQQAQTLNNFLKTLPLEVIYSSDLSRAKETAVLASDGMNCNIIVDAALKELAFGDAEGLTIDVALEKYGHDLWNNFCSIDESSLEYGFPGGEKKGIALKRMRDLITNLSESEFRHIGISTHGGALRCLLHSYMPEETNPIQIANCIVYKLEVEKDSAVVSGPIFPGFP